LRGWDEIHKEELEYRPSTGCLRLLRAQAANQAAMTKKGKDMPGKSLGSLRICFGHTLFLCVQSPKNEQEKTFTVQPDKDPGQTMALETQCIWIGFCISGRSGHC